MKFSVILILIFLYSGKINAQGDGARMLLWGPKDVTAFIPKWMHLEQNVVPGNILIKDANVTIDVFPMTLVHNFNLGGRFAQIMVNATPGSVTGTLDTNIPVVSSRNLSNSGWADGFVGFKLGLINQPSLNVMDFAKHLQKFSMMSYFRVWYPGSYSQKNPLNLGTNRFTFELGTPMNLHFETNPKRPTILEMYPAIHLFTKNTDPTIATMANETQQLALFSFENHLTHNFTDKFWAGVDLRYQYGGAVKVDGVKQDNKFNTLGSGVVVGYQVLSMFGLNTTYGGRIAGTDGSDYSMFKISAVFSYVNMKKVKQEASKTN